MVVWLGGWWWDNGGMVGGMTMDREEGITYAGGRRGGFEIVVADSLDAMSVVASMESRFGFETIASMVGDKSFGSYGEFRDSKYKRTYVQSYEYPIQNSALLFPPSLQLCLSAPIIKPNKTNPNNNSQD